jgi:Glycosyltransferase
VLSQEASLKGRRLVFIVTEDWFFCSHFLPMARAARELELDVSVVCRVRKHRDMIEATGARVIPLEADRKSLNPFAAAGTVLELSRILRDEKADIIHCIALRSILVGGAAAALAKIRRRIYALTGLGFLGARTDFTGRIARSLVRNLVRLLTTRETCFLFENTDDPKILGLDPSDERRVTIVGGAGVDPDLLVPSPLPPASPLKIAVVARMLWSKGIDLAVQATEAARQRGAEIELSLYGAPDPSNPKAVPEQTLQDWASQPGIIWHGPTSDVPGVWQNNHVCCLPSRGGEGLPRTLLEGACCGRAIVTTDVPGCRDLVRNGREGFVVPANDAAALTEAFLSLASDPQLVTRMGKAARERILDGYTERDVMKGVQKLYRRCLQ